MRIPGWTPDARPQPRDLVDAIRARRGGHLLNLDRALLWSEPLARGWNTYLKAVRSELGADRKLRELAICTVALLTGADYEYRHHSADFLAFGGTQDELDALAGLASRNACRDAQHAALGAVEQLVVRYAAQMTLDVRVDDALFAALARHFDTTGLVELTSAIATYNMVARFLVALAVEPEP